MSGMARYLGSAAGAASKSMRNESTDSTNLGNRRSNTSRFIG